MAGVVTKGTEYANGSQITSSNLNALVDDAKFSSNAVDNGSTALNDSAIPAIIVKNAGISAVKLATDAVETAKIKDSNVTTAKILDANVTTAKIADSNVTTAKIAADAVTTAKIADDVALGGNPTTTTQSASNNSTRIATTAYVDRAVGLANACLSRDVLVTIDTTGNLNTPVTASTWDSQTGDSAYYTFSSGVVTIVQAGSYLCGYSGAVSSNSYSTQRFDIMKGTSGSVGTTLVSGTFTTIPQLSEDAINTLNVGVTGAIKLSANDTLTLRAQRTGGTGSARYEDLEFFIVKLT